MVHVVVHLNRSLTDAYYPLFECVYAFEIFNTLFYIFGFFPYGVLVLWNARPFHRNLRILMCNLCNVGVMGTSARLVVMFHQYFRDGGYEESTPIIIASIARVAMLSYFMNVFFFIALDRLISTVAWSWYEKQTISTLHVSIILECCSFSLATGLASALVFSVITVGQLLIFLVSMATFGLVFLLAVLIVNQHIALLLGKGVLKTRYTISRAYQIKENVNVIKIAYASMDVFISIYPLVIVSYVPFADAVFGRSLKRLKGGQELFAALEPIFRWLPPTRSVTSVEPVRSESDVYFHIFNLSINGNARPTMSG